MSLLSPNLQAFLSVCRLGSVHAAAKVLGLTQTGITQRIRSLESELGSTMFLRSRRGMSPTAEGAALLRYCLAAHDLEGETLSQIQQAGVAREIVVTVAAPTSVCNSRIVAQCTELYAKWPRLQLNFLVTDEIDRVALLRAGKAALVVVPPEEVTPELDSKMLRPDRYVLVAASRWKGRRLSDILQTERLIDFHERDLTSLNYLKKFDLLGQLKRPRLFANTNESIIQFFSAGVGFGTLTHEVARPHLAAGNLIRLNGGQTMDDALALAWYPRPEMPKYFSAIVRAIK